MLTDRKRQQLHDDMLQYFETVGFDTVASVFKEAMQNGPVKQALDTPALERKYANILRQAKLLTAAEAMNKQLSQQIEELQDPSTVKRTVAKDFLPSRLLHTLEGHGNKKEITSLCFHPAQPLCFSAAEDGKIKTWDYESGEGIGTLLGHEGAVKCISVDNAGERLASSSDDTDIRVFDISSETCIRRLQGHEHTVSHVEWVRPDCHLLVSASRDGSARLWDVANSCVTKIFRAAEGDWLRCARVDKGIVIVAGDDKIIRSWDVSGGNEKLIGYHDHVIEKIAVANEGATELLRQATFASNDENGRSSSPENGIRDNDSQFIASAGRDKMIFVWNSKNCSKIMTLGGHKDWVRDLVFHPTGKYLISGSDDGTVKLWSLIDARLLRTISVQESTFVSSVSYHPAGRYFISGSSDNQLTVYKCE